MNMKRRHTLKLAAVLAIGTSLSVAQPALAAPPGYNDTVDAVRGVGSDTTYFANQKLAALYNGSPGCSPDLNTAFTTCLATQPPGVVTTENYDHDEVVDAWLVGSSNGVRQLCNNPAPPPPFTADYARSSREPQGTDCAGLTFRPFSKDAIVPIIFPNTSATPGSRNVTNLTRDQLIGIFNTCQITDWGQIPGGIAGQPIIPWGVQTGSGTYQTFRNYLGADPNNCSPAERRVQENDAGPIAAAGPDVHGDSISWFSLGRYLSAPFTRQGGATTSVNGVDADPGTILTNTYPISRDLFLVQKNNSSQATKTYLDWICRTSGHGINPQTGENFDSEITAAISSSGFIRSANCPNPRTT